MLSVTNWNIRKMTIGKIKKYLNVLGEPTRVSNEEHALGEVIVPTQEEPTVETAPVSVDVPVQPLLEHDKVSGLIERLDELQCARTAVENYIELIELSPKGISKQAAVIINIGMEHIVSNHNLKRRSLGIESFEMNSTASMEFVDVDTKELKRYGTEIGAKIIEVLRKLWSALINSSEQYLAGWKKIQSDTNVLLDKFKALKGKDSPVPELELKTNPLCFIEGKFIGDEVTKNELEAVSILTNGLKALVDSSVPKFKAVVNSSLPVVSVPSKLDEIIKETNAFEKTVSSEIELPGGHLIKSEGFKLLIENKEEAGEVNIKYSIKSSNEYVKQLILLKDAVEWLLSFNRRELFERIDKESVSLIKNLRSRTDIKNKQEEAAFNDTQDKLVSFFKNGLGNPVYRELTELLMRSFKNKTNIYKGMLEQWSFDNEIN